MRPHPANLVSNVRVKVVVARLLTVGWLGGSLGCSAPPPSPVPDAAMAATVAADSEASNRDRGLRFAAGAAFSPTTTFEVYDQLFEDVARSLGRPYTFIQRRTHQELNDLLLAGQVDLAFSSTGAYASLPVDARVEIVAIPEVNGQAVFHSIIVVRADSRYQTFADLAGARFAYTDPLSLTGFAYPCHRVMSAGSDANFFFSHVMFSGSHDRSLFALQHGLVDAAAVLDLGMDRYLGPRGRYAGTLRVIETSPGFPPPPVVSPLSTPSELRQAFQRHLLALADSSDGRAQLARLGVSRFRAPGRVNYDNVRKLMEVATATCR